MSSRKSLPSTPEATSLNRSQITFSPCVHMTKVLSSHARDTVLRSYGLAIRVSLLASPGSATPERFVSKDGSSLPHSRLIKLRAKILKCKECSSSLSPSFMCLQCSYVGCWKKGHAHAHAKHDGHVFGIDAARGHILCFRCGDYVGDPSLEEIRIKIIRSMKLEDYPGMPIYQKESDSGKEELISQWSRIPTYRASTGLRGFVNMGATCFMSSILQTMVHNPFIRDYYMSGEHFDCDKELGECIACCVGEIFSEFYTSNKTNGYGPTALLTAAWKVKRSLAGYSEQDAHEFWQFTLDELHKAHVAMNEDKIELSKRQKKNSSPHAMLLDCSCVTHKTFAGELQSSIMCTKCSSLTLTADPMLDLSLEISKKEDDNNNLISCLDKFTNIESLDMMYNCDTCGKRTPATKKLTIKRLSPVLAIQLKRFEHFSATTSKIDTHVKFPLMLDVAKYTLDGSNITGDKTYELFAVVCHIGSVNTGHYICYVKSREGKWFKFDDAVVTLVPSEEVLKVRAYLLYYIIHRLP